MRALVTGGAGFIGSHLAQALAVGGHTVTVVDCLTDYYDVAQKRANLATLPADVARSDADLRTAPLEPLLEDVDVVFHLAAQPGVRLSWAEGFAAYDACNISVTQRLLEACRSRPLQRFVYASSSSVYGDAERYPTTEDDLPQPRSPYGVTKLAAEHLCNLYAASWGVPAVSLRYFSVYGPRQRPDMAFHRLCRAVLGGEPFPQYGDGSQVRDFTYVDDVVAANLAAAQADLAPGTVVNVAGGSSTSLAEAVATVEELSGRPVPLDQRGPARGDVARTGGSTERAHRLLGWSPLVDLRVGLARQLDWHRAGATGAVQEQAVQEPAARDASRSTS
jgi:UDP-glucuronate 4-epimerase